MSQIKVDSIVPRGGLASGTQGGIIQMKYTPVRSVISSSTTTTGTHISAFDTTITPLSNSSRIIIQFYCVVSSSGGNTVGFMIRRGSAETDELRADADGSRLRYTSRGATTWNADQNHCHNYMLNVMDHPSTTSAVTYRLYAGVESSNTVYFNRTRNNTNNSNPVYSRAMSSMLCMEVSG